MGLLEAKINDLIEKLKFEKEILKYIDEKKDDILIRQIDEHFDELDSIYRVFYDSGFCIFGGTFEGVDDLDITYENIIAPIKFEVKGESINRGLHITMKGTEIRSRR